MWSDADFSGVGGGGFDNFGSQSQSAAPASDNKKRHSSVVPVAIKQILDCQDDSLQIAGMPVSMMQIVGIVRSINITSTKIQYNIQDWSGVIDGMLWLEGDSDPRASNVIENTYCRMTGTLRRNDNAKIIFVYNIAPIENLYELTHHYLQIIYIPLKAEEQRQVQAPTDNTEVPMNNGMNLLPQQARVYRAIQLAKTDAGMHKNEILQSVKIPSSELDKIIEFLIDEGHIYATIDDFHYINPSNNTNVRYYLSDNLSSHLD